MIPMLNDHHQKLQQKIRQMLLEVRKVCTTILRLLNVIFNTFSFINTLKNRYRKKDNIKRCLHSIQSSLPLSHFLYLVFFFFTIHWSLIIEKLFLFDMRLILHVPVTYYMCKCLLIHKFVLLCSLWVRKRPLSSMNQGQILLMTWGFHVRNFKDQGLGWYAWTLFWINLRRIIASRNICFTETYNEWIWPFQNFDWCLRSNIVFF